MAATRSHDEIEAAAVRDASLMRLRREGQTFEAIADTLGFSRQYAWRRYWELMKEHVASEVSEYRAEQLDRYDWLIREAVAVLGRDHVVVSQGRVMREGKPEIDEESGEAVIREGHGSPLLDDGPKLAAIREIRAIEAQRTELLGTKTPVKVEIGGGTTVRYELPGGLEDL